MRSATLNCDAMSTCIILAMLYVLIRHIYAPGPRDIIYLVLLFTAGMWTKKSVLNCAVVVGIVLFYEYIVEKNKDFYKALLLFVVSIPISFGWYIRLKVLWNIPFTFLWAVKKTESVAGYIKDVPVLKRLSDFDIAHFGYLYTYIKNNTKAIDINPLTVLIKTSANDLWLWSYYNDAVTKLSYHLVLIRLIIVLTVVIGMIAYLIKEDEGNTLFF